MYRYIYVRVRVCVGFERVGFEPQPPVGKSSILEKRNNMQSWPGAERKIENRTMKMKMSEEELHARNVTKHFVVQIKALSIGALQCASLFLILS